MDMLSSLGLADLPSLLSF